MTTIPTFSGEVLARGKDAYEKNTSNVRSFIHSVTGATDAVVQFLHNPWDAPTDWVFIREIWALDGLRTGDRMPPGLGVFPAMDRKEQVSPQTGKPCLVVVPDPLLDLVKPGQFDKNGKHSPRTSLVVNAVFISGTLTKKADYNPAPGEQVVLRFSLRLGERIIDRFEEKRQEDPGFDATASAWEISITGTGASSRLKIAKQPLDLDTRDVTAMDLPAVFGEIRADAERAISALGTGEVAQPEAFTGSDDALMDEFDAAVGALREEGMVTDTIGAGNGPTFEGVSDARLRRLLTDASVPVPRGAKRDVLVQLASANGINAS